jgi:hypothetical protein
VTSHMGNVVVDTHLSAILESDENRILKVVHAFMRFAF